MTILLLALAVGGFLAFANGANDNFKGVATLYGGGTTSFRGALRWATLGQVLGSVTALVLAKGLLATRFGFPISTTHALTGALTGAGLLAGGVNVGKLGSTFLALLLISPAVAVAAGAVGYLALRTTRTTLRLKKESCACVGVEATPDVTEGGAPAARTVVTASTGTTTECAERYDGRLLGLSAQRALDTLHFASGGIVCFARALNDTPKIAATLFVAKAIHAPPAFVIVAVAMAVGGWVSSRRVAETMAHKVTAMSPGQGFSANLATGLLVVFASRFGLPVSTTHVSVGSMLGVDVVTGRAQSSARG